MNHKIPAVLYCSVLSVMLWRASTGTGLSQSNIRAWGDNQYGQCNAPTVLTNAVKVAAGEGYSLALTADGRVVVWGLTPLLPAGLRGIVDVSLSPCNVLAILADGTVIAFGAYTGVDYGQNNVPADLSNVVAVAAGLYHSLALKKNGTVVAWGDDRFGQSSVPTNLSGVIAISGGYFHSLALKRDGTVVGWGHQGSWNPIPPEATSVIKIIAADYRCLALRADGKVVAWWGRGPLDQPCRVPALSEAVDISGGPFEDLALKADGTIVSWGYNGIRSLYFPSVRVISAGEYHCLALLAPDGRRVPVRLAMNSDGVITIHDGGIGLTYRLESIATVGSNGLWTPLGYITLTNQPQQAFRANTANSAAQFFRAVQVP